MPFLCQFDEEIKIAGCRISKSAYKMDGHENNDMRISAGLGTIHSCDYFKDYGNFVVLLEETQLIKTIKSFKDQYNYLSREDQEYLSNARVREENTLKVYGSLLVLCRLAEQKMEVKEMLQGKKYIFWLVASGMNSQDNIALQNVRLKLCDALKGALGGSIVERIEVFSSKYLEQKISNYESTP